MITDTRVVVPDDFNDMYGRSERFASLRERAQVEIFTTPFSSLDELVGRIGDAQIIVANRERLPLSADLFDRVPKLEMVAQTGMAGAHMDLAAATERGIVFAGTSGGSSATPELTIGLMLAAMRRIPFGDAEVRAGRWSQFVGREVSGLRLGIIGLGRIGSQVAKVCQALGMTVSAWGPTLTPERAAASGVTYLPMETVLAESDVVSVHLRLSPLSRGLIDRDKLALLKSSALFVNTARAAIVDEAALVDMLRDGRLWGAALDVYSQEPLPRDHGLLALPNVVLTPHVGWVAQGGYERFIDQVVENIEVYLDGRPVPRPINPEVISRQARG